MGYSEYTHWIFRRIPSQAGGEIEVRIGRYAGLGGLYTTTGTTVLLYTGPNPILDVTAPQRSIQDQNCDLVTGEVTVTILDRFTYEGVTGGPDGGPMAGDMRIEGELTGAKTLFNGIFDNPDEKYYLWLTWILPDGSRQIYFSGDIDFAGIKWDNSGVGEIYQIGTENEERISKLTITAYFAVERMRGYTMGNLRDTLSDPVAGPPLMEGALPFYNGYIPHRADPNADDTPPLPPNPFTSWDECINQAMISADGPFGPKVDDLDTIGVGVHYDYKSLVDNTPSAAVFPGGFAGVKITRLLDRITNDLDFHFDPDLDFESAFWWYKQYIAGVPGPGKAFSGYSIELVPIQEHILHFQYLFGISPTDGNDFSSNAGFEPGATCNEFIKALAWFYGDYIWPEIDQDDGKLRLRLLSRRESRGNLPAFWKDRIMTSVEQDWMFGKTHVVVKNRNDETSVICPDTTTGGGLDVEIMWRTREWGHLQSEIPTGGNVYANRHMYPNAKAGARDQHKHFNHYDDAAERLISQDGWLMGSYVYCLHPKPVGDVATNVFYQGISEDLKAHYAPDGVTTGWEGFYALRACTENEGDVAGRGNTLVAQAQLYAHENLGPRRAVEITYAALTDGDGKMDTIQCNIETTFKLHNVVRTWRAWSVKPDVARGTTTILWVEKIDYDSIGRLPYRIRHGESSATGGSSGSGGGGTIITGGGGGAGSSSIQWRDAGTLVATLGDANFIAGGNITVSVVHNTGANRVDITIENDEGAVLTTTGLRNFAQQEWSFESFAGNGTASGLTCIIEVDTTALPPTGGFSITLPLASAVNTDPALRFVFLVQDVGGRASNAGRQINVKSNALDTINGAALVTLASDYGAVMGTSDGGNRWRAFKMNGA